MISLPLYKTPLLQSSHMPSISSLPSTTNRVTVSTMFSGEKGQEDSLRAVSFAAGTAAFMACIERAVMVSVFVHWRVWAFLALNLLLLAILFTSKSQISLNQTQCKSKELKRSKKRSIRHSNQVSTDSGAEMAPPCTEVSQPPPVAPEVEREIKSDEIEKLEDYNELSEEELKQRVEDFIAMFRQHLICDAKGTQTQVMGCATGIMSRVY